MARRIEFSTTCRPKKIFSKGSVSRNMQVYVLGTPETSLRGLNTLNALNALTSKLSFVNVDNAVLIILEKKNRNIPKCRHVIAILFFKISTYPITTIVKSNKFQPFLK